MRTTYTSDKVLNLYRGTTFTAPAAVYAGLITAITDEEAGTVTEASYAGYARKAITFGAPGAFGGGRQVTNSVAVLFDAKTDAGTATVVAVGIWDAVTAGNLLDIILLDGADPISVICDDTAADLWSSPSHGLSVDQKVRLEAFPGETTLPTGVVENTVYFVITTGLTTDQFKLSATQGGGAIDITVTGRALLHRQTNLVLNQNDQANFATGQLKLGDD